MKLTLVKKEGNENSKLALTKAIKFITNLGLLESKNIVENLCTGGEKSIILNISEDSVWSKESSNHMEVIHKFRDFLIGNCSCEYIIIGDKEIQRDLKILELTGDKMELIEFISDYFEYRDRTHLKKFLDEVLLKLNKEDLMSILNNIKNEISPQNINI